MYLRLGGWGEAPDCGKLGVWENWGKPPAYGF